jgi:hypothetical protein
MALLRLTVFRDRKGKGTESMKCEDLNTNRQDACMSVKYKITCG